MSNNTILNVRSSLGDIEICSVVRIALLGLIIYSFLRPAWGEEPNWWRSEFIVDSFMEIALKNEHSRREGVVRKWTTGIRYFFDHQVGGRELHEQLTEMHLQHLAQITGVSIQPAVSRKQANLIIVFSTEQRLAADLKKYFHADARGIDFMMRRSVCLAQIKTTAHGAIRQATVIIPVDRARARGKLVSCVVEELTQVMGLPNDSVDVYPSIFNDQSKYMLLTGLDYLLLKILYDPRLVAGMDRSLTLPVVRKIVDEYQHQNLIQRAEQLVRKGQLYVLLY
jgi:hypothetical protein